ncbi:MAG TPA: FAD:protein FMN transferase [Gaiellaceae bacterium]
MNGFRSMGCDVVVRDGVPLAPVRRLFAERDRRFSRFIQASELNRVNAAPLGVAVVSEDFASMLSLSLDAARATDGLVTPCVGRALTAAGYDRDFALLPRDALRLEPAAVPSYRTVSVRGRIVLRAETVELDLNGVVKGTTVDEALAAVGEGWVSAGGDLATAEPVVVGLPDGGSVTLDAGGLATSSVAKRRWLAGGAEQSHLIDPRTGAPTRSRWRDVTVAAASCTSADVAAKAALLLDSDGPDWLDERGLAGRFVDRRGVVVFSAGWAGHALAA